MAIQFKHQILICVLYLTDQLLGKLETQKAYKKRQSELGLLDKIIRFPSIMRLILWLTILGLIVFPTVSSKKPSAYDLYKKNHNDVYKLTRSIQNDVMNSGRTHENIFGPDKKLKVHKDDLEDRGLLSNSGYRRQSTRNSYGQPTVNNYQNDRFNNNQYQNGNNQNFQSSNGYITGNQQNQGGQYYGQTEGYQNPNTPNFQPNNGRLTEQTTYGSPSIEPSNSARNPEYLQNHRQMDGYQNGNGQNFQTNDGPKIQQPNYESLSGEMAYGPTHSNSPGQMNEYPNSNEQNVQSNFGPQVERPNNGIPNFETSNVQGNPESLQNQRVQYSGNLQANQIANGQTFVPNNGPQIEKPTYENPNGGASYGSSFSNTQPNQESQYYGQIEGYQNANGQNIVPNNEPQVTTGSYGSQIGVANQNENKQATSSGNHPVQVGMDTVVSKDNDFNDFDDLSEHKSLKGNLEMYDYGEDFDCGDEENACPEGQYACYSASNNPKCIPQSYVCNGLNDCGDLSDEQGCGCPSDKFTCKTDSPQKCIPIQYKCNTYKDCDDGSDEDTHMCRGCNTTTEFTCNNGDCVPLTKLCDDKYDCKDKTDEGAGCNMPNICEGNQFSCLNGNCISTTQVCNGENNCGDGTDEDNCECDFNEFQCDSGTCISQEYRCNRAPNCYDASDEFGCHCDAPHYIACKSDERCISSSYVCNGENDCGDWSDEKDCPCASEDFPCGNGHCIDVKYHCDNNNDCGDWSDEQGCGDCAENEITCGNNNCVAKSLECNGQDNCGDGTDEEECGGCVWSEWAGVGTCSEPCGIGQQQYERSQSPWGVANANECTDTQTEMQECILSGCTAFYADEATDKLILALRGVDEEIAYSMKWLYAQKTDPGKRIESCEKYADMWDARPALLEVASNNGNAQKQLCDELQASQSGGKERSMMSRSDSGQNKIGTRQRLSRAKREASLGPRRNMGQATQHAIGKVLGRIRNRVSEIVQAKKNGTLKMKAKNWNQEIERGLKSGINGVSEVLPEPADQNNPVSIGKEMKSHDM